MNIATFINAAAAGDPGRAALVIDDHTFSYGELAAAVERCAARLAADDLAGKRVAVVDVGSLLSIATLLGAARIGAVAALMNPALTPAEVRGLLDSAECADVVIAGEAHADRVREAGVPKVLTGAELLSDNEIAAPLADGVDDREALVLFTSGTTGLPKAIGITHGQLTRRITGVAVPFQRDAKPTVGMMTVPYFHVGGAIGLLGNLYAGNTYVVLNRFDAGQWLRLVQKYRAASTFLVPTMLQRILDHPDFADTDLSSLAAIAYGAAAAPTTLVRRAMDAMPNVAFANVFGQTETLGAYTTLAPEDHRDPRRVGSVGRPLAGVEVRVVDPDTGDDVEPGTVGELWVKSNQNVTEDWLRTGDLARQDADGYIYPSGRLKDTINRGGEKFGPIEVEEALRSHPAIVDVAVAGIADDEMGQRVGAAVVASTPVTLEQLREHCREHIAYFKLPERLALVEQIPYNDTGKVNRRRLAALIADKA
ncbi:MAG TPA: class I adenylate-forming enzyme family protein [Mycobacterium sp.]|nr:class I adenylate-forming enzyme family protein [Mycobacterium sp.]